MRIGIGLGSNVGDRAKQLALARRWLRGLDVGARFSSEYETSPVDCAPGTPPFWNQVGEINWSGSLETLLQWMQDYERSCGRKTVRGKNEPRVLIWICFMQGGTGFRIQDWRFLILEWERDVL